MDIEPCPFCVGDAELDESEDVVFVRCDSCSAQGPACDLKEDAIDIWNQVSMLALEEEED